MEYKIFEGDCLEQLEKFRSNSIDCIITDPPYELNFMGKGWDNAGVSFNKETWEKCLRVLKPGGYLLAFGGTRTYHRIACAVEDAGFEIRDCIMWLYGSGFPKSMDIEKAINKRDGVEFKSKPAKGVGFMNANDDGWHNTLNQLEQIGKSSNRAKKWKGWGSALKPSYEPIIVARKPFKGSLVDNVMKYGVGGLNIDECRVEYQDDADRNSATPQGKCTSSMMDGAVPDIDKSGRKEFERPELKGRFPANTILDTQEGEEWRRYFYCAKASKRDRNEGLENVEPTAGHAKGNGLDRVCEFCGTPQLKAEDCHCPTKSWVAKPKQNSHPTVKPTSLMQYLVRLVAPKGAIILDPFMGSGSTGKAVAYENLDRNAGYKFIGIEKDAKYCEIAEERIKYVIEKSIDKTT